MDDEKYTLRINELDFSLTFRITDPLLRQAYDDNQPVFIETLINYLCDATDELNLFDFPDLQERLKVIQRDAKKKKLEVILKRNQKMN
ncbi:MAG: hypothetical protein AABX93_01940 [Nanoarchaeota archaeon]